MPYGLIADIGGTNARFALADERDYYDELIFPCADFKGPREAVKSYLDAVKPKVPVTSGAFAIAGPVHGDVFKATNMPWAFSVSELRDMLGFERLALYNDFEAIAMCVPHLAEIEVRQVGGGKARTGWPIGVIGPGTGLGVASLYSDGHDYRAVPAEGGHTTAPAVTQREFDIFHVLLKKYSHVSAERVCSGKGLVNLYNAIRELDRRADLPDLEPKDISKAAIGGTCPVSKEALDLMLAVLGRVAGNLALTCGAFGGIYIAGGIVPKLGDYFDESAFRSEFEAKGRLRFYMEPIPTFVVLHPHPAFLGLQKNLGREPVRPLA